MSLPECRSSGGANRDVEAADKREDVNEGIICTPETRKFPVSGHRIHTGSLVMATESLTRILSLARQPTAGAHTDLFAAKAGSTSDFALGLASTREIIHCGSMGLALAGKASGVTPQGWVFPPLKPCQTPRPATWSRCDASDCCLRPVCRRQGADRSFRCPALWS
jgi:hypothetical protein